MNRSTPPHELPPPKGPTARKRRWPRVLAGCIAALLLLLGVAAYLANNIELRDAHVSVPADSLDAPLQPADLRADIALYVSVLRETHPDFDGIGGGALEHQAQLLSESITEPITRLELYSRLASLSALLRDGHTGLRLPLEERDRYDAQDGRYPPFTVRMDGDVILIEETFAESVGLAAGDTLLTLNGVPAARLVEIGLAQQSGESKSMRQAFAEQRFYRDLLAVPVTSPFVVGFARGA